MSDRESWFLLLVSLIPLILGMTCLFYRKEVSRWLNEKSIYRFIYRLKVTPQNERLVYLQTALAGVLLALNGVFGIIYVLKDRRIEKGIFAPLIAGIICSALAAVIVGWLASLKR